MSFYRFLGKLVQQSRLYLQWGLFQCWVPNSRVSWYFNMSCANDYKRREMGGSIDVHFCICPPHFLFFFLFHISVNRFAWRLLYHFGVPPPPLHHFMLLKWSATTVTVWPCNGGLPVLSQKAKEESITTMLSRHKQLSTEFKTGRKERHSGDWNHI